MIRVRERDRETAETRFELQEWLSALLSLGALMLGAMGTLGLVYLLVAAR